MPNQSTSLIVQDTIASRGLINLINRAVNMVNSNDQFLSRRQWLRWASISSVGASLLAVTNTAAKSLTHSQNNDQNLGACTYNIRDFGAKGDGTTLDTAAIQAAIDTCNKDQGGTVLVPAELK